MMHYSQFKNITDAQKLPNFLLIGAQKSGTTALYYALREHPDIFMSSIKEPRFFLSEKGIIPHQSYPDVPIIDSWDRYVQLFETAGSKQAIGEASVMYLSGYNPERTAARVKQYLPKVKMIAILRHPAERAYSAYTYFCSRNIEPLPTFTRALNAEQERIKSGVWPDLCYLRNGLYYDNLSKFYQLFPRDQIKVFLYEQWNQMPQVVLKEIFRFLNVDDTAVVSPLRHAVTSRTRWNWLNNTLSLMSNHSRVIPARWRYRAERILQRCNQVKPPPLDSTIKHDLTEFYREDIIQLQNLIGLDLEDWLV